MTLPEWLADPALRPVWEVVHDRLEQRGPDWRGRASVDIATPAQRRALSSLLGRALAGERVTLDVRDLDERAANMGGVTAVVEQVVGPVHDRRSARAVATAEREAPVRAASAALPPVGWAAEWLAFVRRSRPTPSDAVLAARLLGRLLDGHEPVSRQDLAAGATGDAHALDDGTALAALVLRGLALAADVVPAESARARRELWGTAGVVLDGVSTTCLVLGLPVRDGRLAARLSDGHPLHLTARDLRGASVGIHARTEVLVCENPRVLEAVADAGLSVPMVCGNGNPNLVVMDVLTTLSGSGARLHYHGDFDWPGLAIANRLVAAVGVEPWLMSASDYRTAASSSQLALRGGPVDAAWDPSLTLCMNAAGVAVHEESLLPSLVSALRDRGPRGAVLG